MKTEYHGYPPMYCFCNVERHVEEHGGCIVYGWLVGRPDNIMEEWTHHAVWRSPDGELVDVTPQSYPACTGVFTFSELEFREDPSATPVGTKPNRLARPSRIIPVVNDPDVIRAAESYNSASQALLNGEHDRCNYWLGRAERNFNRYFKRHGQPTISIDRADYSELYQCF